MGLFCVSWVGTIGATNCRETVVYFSDIVVRFILKELPWFLPKFVRCPGSSRLSVREFCSIRSVQFMGFLPSLSQFYHVLFRAVTLSITWLGKSIIHNYFDAVLLVCVIVLYYYVNNEQLNDMDYKMFHVLLSFDTLAIAKSFYLLF